jgi:DNA-binding Xre family transcriptional regulator
MKVRVRIKELAEQQGLTAKALAKKASVPLHTIERLLESGTAENIRVSTLGRIGEALGVSTGALIVDVARD